jgi:hypothetical protein
MKCIKCEVRSIENAAKLLGERVIETLDGETVNVFVVPTEVALDVATKKQNDPVFVELYLSMQYKAGDKVCTCK